MDATITYDEVANLVGVDVPMNKNKRPDFDSIRLLRRYFERALQCLPCPQSTLHRWKGLVMNRALYALHTPTPFRVLNDPGPNAVYVREIDPANPNAIPDAAPITRTEQATIVTRFVHRKHYFLSMRNIECTCFTVIDSSINDAFKVLNDPSIQGWHAGMSVMFILDQLSNLYGQPTPAVLEMNDTIFRSPYSAANAPEVLFRCIEEWAETALLGCNPYMDWQPITNAIHLLLTTGLYTRLFKEWDHLTLPAQTWIALCTLIQEAFQWRLNATAPTAGAHRYALAQSFRQNEFGALATTNNLDTKSVDGSIATQMAALTYQSQLIANMAANKSVQQKQQLAHLAAQQEMMHQNMHQLIARMNAVTFNQSNEGRGIGRLPPEDTEVALVYVFVPVKDDTSKAMDVAPPFLVFIPQGVST
jgi:hypothetical protein